MNNISNLSEENMTKITRVFKNEYRDSLFLMKLSDDVSSWENISQAVIVMGTESNKSILSQVGLLDNISKEATANDLIVAIEGNPELSEVDFLKSLERRMTDSTQDSRNPNSYADLKGALVGRPNSSLVFISVPGQYAAPLVHQALDNGKHVFCFSQHMSIEDEIKLKKKAIEQDLLMMGPDCGTAYLDGVGVGFSNQVRRGAIGIVSAAGSGLQEVMSLIDRAGGGVSQAIGVGGRDMTDEVGGLMAEAAVKLIEHQGETQVIVILAKKAAPIAMERVLAAASNFGLPIVANFATVSNRSGPQSEKVIFTDTFEECALEALKYSGIVWDTEETTEPSQKDWIKATIADLPATRRFMRGLFGGGSLCAEASSIFEKCGFDPITNLDGPLKAVVPSHILLDLGAEEYTQGIAHPFIDPRSRLIEIEKAWTDPQVGVLLLDVVLGWGCHLDPTDELARLIDRLRKFHGESPALIASVCGTHSDPQDFSHQVKTLRDAGFFVAPCNAAAAYLATDLVAELRGLER